MKADKEAQKCKQILKEWGRRPVNKVCADCGLKQPGWASTNIGVIVCIHCSGIHRKLGVHISFVKSLTLDRWPMKLVRSFMAQGGNIAINEMYEANLPRGIKPNDPTDMRRLETFIRNKYQHKKWYKAEGKKKKKKKKRAEVSDSDSNSDSSDSESSEPEPKKTKKVDKGDRTRKSKRKKRRPRPAPAKPTTKKSVKKEAVNKPVAVATPADDVPDLLDFESMKIQTNLPAKNDEFNLFSDFSSKAQTSPPSFLPGMSDQPSGPQPVQNQIDPFQANPVQQQANARPQSATDKVMDLFKHTQQPQQNHNANIFTQINGPGPSSGFGNIAPKKNFQQQRPIGGFQQQRPMQGFQQQRPMQGFQQQRSGFQQQQPGMGFGGGFQQQMGFGARPNPNQMGFQQGGFQQQNQRGFRQGGFQQQQPTSGFAPQQQQNAFSSFGNVQQNQNNSGGFGFI